MNPKIGKFNTKVHKILLKIYINNKKYMHNRKNQNINHYKNNMKIIKKKW